MATIPYLLCPMLPWIENKVDLGGSGIVSILEQFLQDFLVARIARQDPLQPIGQSLSLAERNAARVLLQDLWAECTDCDFDWLFDGFSETS